MAHYVVMCDWSISGDFINHGVDVTGITHSLEEAKEIFAKAVVDEKKYAEEHGWKIYEDSDVEFDAGEDGYYEAEHAHFFIQEVM